MKRRAIIRLIGGLAIAWPVASRAQQSPKMHRIAIVHPTEPIAEMSETGNFGYRALFQGLHRLGHAEGRNLIVERYSGEGRLDRFAELASLVVRTRPDLIFATSNRLILSFKTATDTIPILGYMADPVRPGLVASVP